MAAGSTDRMGEERCDSLPSQARAAWNVQERAMRARNSTVGCLVAAVVAGAGLLLGVGAPARRARAQNLLVNNQTITLGGIHRYNQVQVINGGRIEVPAYEGSDRVGTGNLQIVANSIVVDSTSSISADGRGYQPRLCDDGAGPYVDWGGEAVVPSRIRAAVATRRPSLG